LFSSSGRDLCQGLELGLEVDFSSYPTKFFAEGGRVEVEYSDKVIYIPDFALESWELPYTADDITITMVAANFSRRRASLL